MGRIRDRQKERRQVLAGRIYPSWRRQRRFDSTMERKGFETPGIYAIRPRERERQRVINHGRCTFITSFHSLSCHATFLSGSEGRIKRKRMGIDPDSILFLLATTWCDDNIFKRVIFLFTEQSGVQKRLGNISALREIHSFRSHSTDEL